MLWNRKEWKGGFFQAVKSGLVKTSTPTGKPKEELDSAIRQIISKAIVSDEVTDIFDAVGLKNQIFQFYPMNSWQKSRTCRIKILHLKCLRNS